MSAIRSCFKCGEAFFAGSGGRLVCGVCWPVNNGVSWTGVPISAERRAANRMRMAAAGEAEASGQSLDGDGTE